MEEKEHETQSVSFSVEPTLELFDAIESGQNFTQRNLSVRIGVALGLINAVIKRCVKKGLVKVQQAPAKRYAYYLTPSGFREKSHLVSDYLQSSLKIFRRARLEYSEIFAQCQERGWCVLAICGASDLGEIAIISTLGTGVRIHAIIDPGYDHPEFHNLPVVKTLADAKKAGTVKIDAVVLTHQEAAQDMFEWLSDQMEPERLFTPPILHVSRKRNDTRAGGEQ